MPNATTPACSPVKIKVNDTGTGATPNKLVPALNVYQVRRTCCCYACVTCPRPPGCSSARVDARQSTVPAFHGNAMQGQSIVTGGQGLVEIDTEAVIDYYPAFITRSK